MEHATPTDYAATWSAMAAEFKRQPGRAPIGFLAALLEEAQRGPTPAPPADSFRRSALLMNRFVDAEIAAKADIAILMLLRIGCKLQFVDHGPTIGRKRRARRAGGRGRADD